MHLKAWLWIGCIAITASIGVHGLRFDEVKLPANTPKVFKAASTVKGDTIYMFGGWQDDAPSSTLWALDTRSPSDGWKEVEASGTSPSARWGATMVTLGGTIYLFGGFDGKGHQNDMYTFTPESSQWAMVNPSGSPPPGSFSNQGVTTYDNKFWVFALEPSGRQLSVGYVFDPTTSSWNSKKISGSKYNVPSSRWGHVLLSDKEIVFLFGGTEHGEKSMIHDNLYQLSLNALRWNVTEMNDVVANEEYKPDARSAACGGIIGGSIFIFGGKDFMGPHDDLFKYDIESNIWSKESVKGFPPTPRDSHSCVVVGERLYIFGGYDGEHVYGDLTILTT